MRIFAALLTVLFCLFLAGMLAMAFAAPPQPDYEAQANCIAEYDYQHPQTPMMDNLITALEKCR